MSDDLDPIDVHLGLRLRKIRTMMGMSQKDMGAALSVAFQQVQKYESGVNRIAASRLYEMSKILNVPITYFFEDIVIEPIKRNATGLGGNSQGPFEQMSSSDQISPEHRETLEFARVYKRIADPHLRRQLLNMMRAMAGVTDEKTSDM